MAVLPADVTARAKEFATLSTDEVQTAIDDAALQINADAWGTRADLATIYLAAHALTLQNPSLAAPAGPVQSEKVGDISRAYAVPARSGMGQYDTTRWGREYMRLVRQNLGAQVL